MILLLLLFSSLLVFFIAMAVRSYRQAKDNEVYEHLPKEPATERRIRIVPGFQNQAPKSSRQQKIALLLTLPSGVLAALILSRLGGDLVLGFAIGCVLPFNIAIQIQRQYEKRYREDTKIAFDFAGTIFSNRGSVEEWVEKVIDRLQGPLKSEFRKGWANYKSGKPITAFLEHLIRTSPDSYFQSVMSMILRNYNNGGDLRGIVEKEVKVMNRQDRVARTMAAEQKRTAQMNLFVIGSAAFIFLIFKNSFENTMHLHPWTRLLFFVYIMGLFGQQWLVKRLTNTKKGLD